MVRPQSYEVEGGERITIQSGMPVGVPVVEVVERKGWGHPDKLADDLAEALSREYAKLTLSEVGAVLHHNFDKLCLLGGKSEVSYGKARLTKPVRVLVNGRASSEFAGKKLPVTDLINKTVRDFFNVRLPLLDQSQFLSVEHNISTSSSPGGVIHSEQSAQSARHRWFSPQTLEDLPERKRLYANDTSIGTGFAPLSTLESFVLEVSNLHSHPDAIKSYPWMGNDVKVMGYVDGTRLSVVACIPQLGREVHSRKEYLDNLEFCRGRILQSAKNFFPDIETSVELNARDVLEKDEVYLTAIGSSIESGDEGVVGRGNRINGLITPMRPMNVEGANGKNPVYHVGKLYNIAAQRIAQKLHREIGGAFAVHLISRTGADLVSPWKIIIQSEQIDISVGIVGEIVSAELKNIPAITNELVSSGIMLS